MPNFLLGTFIIFLCVTNILAESSQCGDWLQFKDEKCFKIVATQNTFSFDDAEKQCLQADNGSHLLTIHSKEEQDFISEFVFKTNKVVDNVWLGLKNSNNNFKWSDGSNLEFTNWLPGDPTNKPDHNCVQMSAESNPIGKWSDSPCNKKNIAVCEKIPTISLDFLHKMLLETRKKLEKNILKSGENTSKFNKLLNNLVNSKWMKFELFSNTDGKQKAFFIPSHAYDDAERKDWDSAVNICASFNATLIEIDSSDKVFLLLSYLGQLGLQSNHLDNLWLNAQKDSSGKWKWINSGKEMTYNKWFPGTPVGDSGAIYLALVSYVDENFGKIYNYPKTKANHVICEIDVNF